MRQRSRCPDEKRGSLHLEGIRSIGIAGSTPDEPVET